MKAPISLAAILLAAACGGSTTPSDDGTGGASTTTGEGGDVGFDICDIECVDVPTFRELSWSLCTSCHSSDPAVRRAEGVPSDADFTRYEGVESRIEKVAILVSSTSAPMPPAGATPLTVGEKAEFTKWSCCGGPP
jgi:uncharacterized membrane protein